MHASIDAPASNSSTPLDITPPSEDSANVANAEQGLSILPHSVPLSVRSVLSTNLDDETELQPTSSSSSGNYIKRKTSRIFKAVLENGVVNLVANKNQMQNVPVAPALNVLVEAYATSTIAAEIKADGEQLRREVVRADTGNDNGNGNGTTSNELPDVILETSMLRGRKRASWATQFRILSGRAFKNLYRDPALLTAHYTSAIALASMCHFACFCLIAPTDVFVLVICGLFYHNVTYVLMYSLISSSVIYLSFSNDISGFQNRLGMP